MADMSSLQEQSRRSFFQWHILLIMKKKQLKATLADARYRPQMVRQIEAGAPPVADSDELALLGHLGLPLPDDLSGYDLPPRQPVAGIRFFFRAAAAFDHEDECTLDCVRQRAHGRYERRELLRVAVADRQYLMKAAEKFNDGLAAYALPLVLNAACVWADFHGAAVLDWSPVSARLLGTDTSSTHGAWFREQPVQERKQRPHIRLNGRTSIFGE